MKDKLIRITLGLLAVLLGWAAVLQLNDVDPVLWAAVYGLAAVLCGLAAAGVRPARWMPAGYAVGALGWAGWLVWQIFVVGDVRPMFEHTTNPSLLETEEGREMIGLIIVAASTGLVAWWAGPEE